MLRIMGVVAKIGHNWWLASLADEEQALQIETADVSLIGHREENQDRVAIAAAEHAVLLVGIDAMGGHADGARAEETPLSHMVEALCPAPHPLLDPISFLHFALALPPDLSP